MVVLVSGAAGFLGQRLVGRLAADGFEVIAMARLPAPTVFASNPSIRWISRDIAQDGLDLIELPDIDAVVHLAGATLGAGKDENLFLRANEQTTVRLFQALAGHVDHFVFASSQVVYGDACHLGVSEEFPLQPEGSAYACSKVNSENWLRWFQKQHGGNYLVLRFCGFIDGGGIVDYLIDRALTDTPIELYSQGKVCRDYLPSAEGVDALIAALKYRGELGFLPVNIGSGQVISAHELATAVCAELQSSSRIYLSMTPSSQRDFVFSIERARKLFDFEPGSLSEAVRRYARQRLEQTVMGGGDAKN